MANRRFFLGAVAFLATSAFNLLPAFAGSYQALCGGSKCTVNVNSEFISSPYGSIPVSRVTSWGGGGDSSTSVGTGVATTILFGGIGLLGFLAKNHDYQFTINGYDVDGRKTSMQIQFKNSKPAKRFMNEIPVVTGLGMGQRRTAAEIRAIESGQVIEPGPMNRDRSLYPKKENRCAVVLSEYDCNYDLYLEANPSIKVWAEANPDLAKKERIRLKAIDNNKDKMPNKSSGSFELDPVNKYKSQ